MTSGSDSHSKVPVSSQTVIPVLGMHRSGTSMLTRALNQLGLELGRPLLDPTPDNPRGYWENTFFVQRNMEILHTLQCDHDGFAPRERLLKLPQLCERIVVEDVKRAEIRQFLEQNFSTARVWGWKDPRSVLTLNLWQRLLSELGYVDVRPVVVVRHPGPSVRSLMRRAQAGAETPVPDDQLAAMASQVWRTYNEILWQLCTRHDWFVTTYETLTDPDQVDAELRRLAGYCGLDEDLVGLSGSSIVSSSESIDSRPVTDPALLTLYDRFRSRAQPPSGTVAASDPDELRLLQRADEFKRSGRIDAAVDLLTRGLEIRSQYRAARFLLGYTLMETGHISRSAEHADVLIKANPQDPVGYGLQAFGLTQQARISEAIAAFRECIRCLPTNSVAWSNMLFASLYSDELDAGDVKQLHEEAGAAIAREAGAQPPVQPAVAKLKRKHPLRVGYLSGDLKRHPVGFFMRSLLTHHNSDRVHAVCYDISPAHDDLTDILRQAAGGWCDAREMSDDALVDQIREDKIDLLIDLAGHSSGNRAAVMTRRAAPRQAMYLGYPGTSGLPNMDFLISDRHISPPKLRSCYTEEVVRLKHCFLCFHPHDDAPEVAPPPSDQNGYVTFGSFNNLPKVSPTTIRLWSRVLHEVTDSRLVLKTLSFQDPGTRDLFHEQFEQQGIERDRVDLLPPTVPLSKFLEEYRRIDIGLDTVPYNGGTTTCESLWMGVPVITIAGDQFCSRMGMSILKTVGLEELIADSVDDYVRLACELAADPAQRRTWREDMRNRLLESPLCDAESFTHDFESRLRKAWNASADTD